MRSDQKPARAAAIEHQAGYYSENFGAVVKRGNSIRVAVGFKASSESRQLWVW